MVDKYWICYDKTKNSSAGSLRNSTSITSSRACVCIGDIRDMAQLLTAAAYRSTFAFVACSTFSAPIGASRSLMGGNYAATLDDIDFACF